VGSDRSRSVRGPGHVRLWDPLFQSPLPLLDGNSDQRNRLPRSVVALGACIVVVAGLTIGEHAFAGWLRSVGVGVIGDQPAYLTQAQSLLRGSVHPLAIFERDLARHYFLAFPPGAKVGDKEVFEGFTGPTGIVSPFEPGLATLIAPFLAVGGQAGAFVGFFAVEIAGLVFVHQRVSRLCQLAWRAQVLLGVALSAPAVAVAATQLYPDLISGILLAAALVELARYELDRSDRVTLVTIAVGVAVLPWLQIKNLIPAMLVCVAFALIAWRHRRPWLALVVVLLVAGIAWGGLIAYNLRIFGHVLGLPEPAPAWDLASLTRTIALLFDRHQGLFVQLPTAMLGVIGLRRAASPAFWTALAALTAVGTVLVLNGTYASNPFGGATPAGRFEWTAMPVAVAFGAFALAHWQNQRRALLRAACVVAALWVFQAAALISYRHTDLYFTQPSPWDPAAYPGWWPGLDRLLPQFVTPPHLLGHPAVGVAFVVLVSVALVWIPTLPLPRLRTTRQMPLVFVAGSLVAFAAMVLAADPGDALPGPLSYPGAALGGPLAAGNHPLNGPAVPLQGIVPGTYRLVAAYSVQGSNAAALTAYCDATNGAPLLARRVELPAHANTVTVQIACAHSGAVAASLSASQHTDLRVDELTLTKVGIRR
jgi:hypothetical protein